MTQIIAIVGLIILGLMTVLWLVSLALRNSSIVDIFWGAGFVIICWIYFYLTPNGFAGRKLLTCTLVSIWGLRLSGYILWRNWGKSEDYRYQNWRNQHGSNWWWVSFFQVFMLQGFLMGIISMPLLAAQYSPLPDRFIWLDYVGFGFWAIGFLFEAGGDFQLLRFKSQPVNKGKLLTSGFWRYTRHPNYFGDALQWWGDYMLALAGGGYWTIFSPIVMTLLLRNVSGVSLLEKSLVETKVGYKEYIETTNAFFPWFPRKPKK